MRRIGFIVATPEDLHFCIPVVRALSGRAVISILACGELMIAGKPDALAVEGLIAEFSLDTRLSGDGPVAAAKGLGLAVLGMADAIERMRPDLVVVTGVAPEMLAAAQACLVMRLPVAHIHMATPPAGRVAEAFGSAITKLSQLHFLVSEAGRQRCLLLGEQPARIFARADAASTLATHPLDGIIVKVFNDVERA